MIVLAFGRKVLVPDAQAHFTALLILENPPKRFRTCNAHIAMRGCNDDYEDWVTITLSAEYEGACAAFAQWVTVQMTRRGFALVPELSSGP